MRNEILYYKLDTMARVVQSWLEWHAKEREKEHLTTNDDTAIICLPVPAWPNHGQLEEWVKTLNEAAEDRPRRESRCLIQGNPAMSDRGPRIAVVLNDGQWLIRRIAHVHQDDVSGEMIYHCDEHIGGPFAGWHELANAVDAYLISVT